jgi:hypothetical protein
MSRATGAGNIKLKDGVTVKQALASFLTMTKPKPRKKSAKRKKRP